MAHRATGATSCQAPQAMSEISSVCALRVVSRHCNVKMSEWSNKAFCMMYLYLVCVEMLVVIAEQFMFVSSLNKYCHMLSL